MTISVLVPCCNTEPYLAQCLDSILAQTFTDLEVICIDDGSSDGTAAILRAYVEADARVTVIGKPNTGYGDSMNIGFARCRGTYIGIVESDDFIEPDMFACLYGLAVQYDLDIARCGYFFHTDGRDVPNTEPAVPKNTVLNPLDHPSVFRQAPAIWASLYRRDLIEQNGIRFLTTPGASYQDTSFSFKTYFRARRFLMTDRCLLHYRQHAGSSVRSQEKALCVCDEWQEIIRYARTDPAGFEKARTFMADMRDGTYRWNFNRLRGAARQRFLGQWSEDLRALHRDGLSPVSRKRRLRCWLIANMPAVFALFSNVRDAFRRAAKGRS